MVTLASLWLVIVAAAAIMWIASALIWMAMPWHKSDFAGLPAQDALVDALRSQGVKPGQYDFPHLSRREDLKLEENQRRFIEGPVGFITIAPRGLPRMGTGMLQSALFCLFVSLLAAYLASRSLPAGADYMRVFQITAVVVWIANFTAVVPDAVWFARPWKSIGKSCLDAAILALLAAGVFGALWPG